jgi:succinoglycan biosynthesis transport protein ExoP
MNLADVFVALRARWRIALIIFVVVACSVGGFSATRTPQYTATASVVLDVKSPDPIAGIVLPGMTTVSYMATQLNILQSERVALRAIQTLGIESDPVRMQQWQAATGGSGDFKAWLSDSLLGKLEVVPTRDSNVINVNYTSADPAFASSVANAFVKAFIDTTLELRVEPARLYNGFFDERGKQLRQELEEAQGKLSAYQQQKGIIASDERLDVETLKLSELTSQMVQLQAVANESGGRQGQSVNNASRMQEVFNSPAIMSMSSDLAKAQARMDELRTRQGENHPDMTELRARIAQLRAGIASETQRVTSSLAIANDINQGRLNQVRAAVEAQRTKLLLLKSQRDQAAVLQRDVENAQRSYESIQTRASQTAIESQATQTNVSVLKQATPPPYPSSPRIRLNMTIGLLLGALLGLAAALLRELRDRRLRTDQDVIRGLAQPLLGVLPAKAHQKKLGTSRLRLTTAAGPRNS